MSKDVLVVENLKKYFPISKSTLLKRKILQLKAVDEINFTVREGETFGLVGESGSGKSTTAYTVIGMYGPTSGRILFKGHELAREASRRPLAVKKDMQMVFQDPGTSLNPQRTIGQIISLPALVHGLVSGRDAERKTVELLKTVELPADYRHKYPRSIGGGERQMVAIARALATEPSFVVLDEPTSALDVSVQAKIINMLIRLQKQFNLSYMFITHDLSLMRNLATRVAIMYLGKIAEIAPTVDFFRSPKHPYTQMLLSSIPVVSKAEEELKPRRVRSRGEIPSPVNVPPGCGFHPRCLMTMDICREADPIMVAAGADHLVRCHLFPGAAGRASVAD